MRQKRNSSQDNVRRSVRMDGPPTVQADLSGGSGSLLGQFVVGVFRPGRRFIGTGDFFLGSPETHHGRDPSQSLLLDVSLADELAREDAFGSRSKIGFLRTGVAADELGPTHGIEGLEDARFGHAIEEV